MDFVAYRRAFEINGINHRRSGGMYGYRQEYHAEAGGLGKAARPQGRQENDYPQGYAGAFSVRQSGEKPTERERCT